MNECCTDNHHIFPKSQFFNTSGTSRTRLIYSSLSALDLCLWIRQRDICCQSPSNLKRVVLARNSHVQPSQALNRVLSVGMRIATHPGWRYEIQCQAVQCMKSRARTLVENPSLKLTPADFPFSLSTFKSLSKSKWISTG